eukprot:4000588-Pyramimonas_sp.AAC.1
MKRAGPSSLSESFGEGPERLTQGGARTTRTRARGPGPRWSPLLSLIFGACWVPWGVRHWTQMVYALVATIPLGTVRLDTGCCLSGFGGS